MISGGGLTIKKTIFVVKCSKSNVVEHFFPTRNATGLAWRAWGGGVFGMQWAGKHTIHTQELRRGMDRADITSICFNQQSTFVACCSDRGTVHIFSLEGGSSNGVGTGVASGGASGSGTQESPRSTSRRAGGAAMNAISG